MKEIDSNQSLQSAKQVLLAVRKTVRPYGGTIRQLIDDGRRH